MLGKVRSRYAGELIGKLHVQDIVPNDGPDKGVAEQDGTHSAKKLDHGIGGIAMLAPARRKALLDLRSC
jgi:hypothetical protein